MPGVSWLLWAIMLVFRAALSTILAKRDGLGCTQLPREGRRC